jgi:archaeosortase A (PGF-CTERM-specific)
MERTSNSEGNIAWLFLIVPTILIILGALYFQYPISDETRTIISIPLFISLILLAVGFFLKGKFANNLKIVGWIIFGFFWSTKINELYFGVDGDIVNAFLCIVGSYVLFYVAYHEWLSLKRKEQLDCLNWFAGVASLAGLIYFIVELTPLAPWLIETVAAHSGWLLNLFIGTVEVYGPNIHIDGVFVVNIIFACTAMQSMVIFVGMILPLKKVSLNKKFYGLLATVVPVYFLNMVRNGLISYLLAEDITSFYIAHNIIGKGGSLIALAILLLIVIKIIPEVFDEIICLADIYKRNGPLEKTFGKIFGRKK